MTLNGDVPQLATRPQRRRVDGVLLVDKPVGITSNRALAQVKRSYDAAKAGHTGTLDPLASGLLPVCFGEATKFAQFLLDASKRYIATVRFGTTTTTQDAEGDVVTTCPLAFDRPALVAALERFVGRQTQVPPAYSALKFQGRAYYDYARAGIDIPRAPREIEILAIDLLEWRPPDAVLDIECSKGTYIRALAADLGESLRCGAHLAALRRIRSGGFSLDDAVTPDALAAMSEDERASCLKPVPALVAHLAALDIEGALALRFRQGGSVAATGHAAGPCAVFEGGVLLGVADVDDGFAHPRRLIASA